MSSKRAFVSDKLIVLSGLVLSVPLAMHTGVATGKRTIDGCACNNKSISPGSAAQPDPTVPIGTHFDQMVAEAQLKVSSLGLSQSTLEIMQGQSIKFTAPSGVSVQWLFNQDGEIYEITDGTNRVRFAVPGSPLRGYDLKIGSADWNPVLSTASDSDGIIHSFTWHPTNYTQAIKLLTDPTTSIPPSSNISALTEIENKLSKLRGTPLENCVKGCAETRNDEADKAKEDFRRCVESVNQATNACFVNAGAGAGLAGAGVGATIGAAAGAPAAGIGAVPGAIMGSIVGFVAGADIAIIACAKNGIDGLNGCQTTYNNSRQERQGRYYRCVTRCYDRYSETK